MSIKEKKSLEMILGNNISGTTLFVLVIFSFALSWIADGVAVFLPESKVVSGGIMIAVSLAILAVLFWTLKHLKKKYASIDNVDIEILTAEPKPVLVLTLSENRRLDELSEIKSIKSKKDFAKAGNWQMPLEAIYFHREKLEKVILLTSRESDVQYDAFVSLFRNCFGAELSLEKECVDMKSLDDLKEGYHRIDRYIGAYKDKDVVFDITSGTVLSSMAGSYFALNEDRVVQYVDTSNYEIKMFNNKYMA